MKWVDIEKEKPPAYESVVMTDGDDYWIGYVQTYKDHFVWWANNPNRRQEGHADFLSPVPKFWATFERV